MTQKLLMKIAIAAAWVDGTLQPEEREYLQKLCDRYQLGANEEIQSLLSRDTPIPIEECDHWLTAFQQESSMDETGDEYGQLLEAVGGLIYSDGEVDPAEAAFLDRLSDTETSTTNPPSHWLLGKLNRWYHQFSDSM
jgi:uncharacterized tellurite resistance protein B-like protein